MTVRTIGAAGTTARAMVGVTLIVVGVIPQNSSWWDVAAAVFVLPVIAVLTTVGVNAASVGSDVHRRGRVPWSGVQVAAACIVICAVIALGIALSFVSPVDGGSLFLFFGGSMLLASWLGYDGCEVLALPNLVLRRRDAIWCPLYSPLDDAGTTMAVDADVHQP